MTARSANSFGRPGARFKPQPTVLVICEDSKSSKNYLEYMAKNHFRIDVHVIKFTHCGKTDPKGIVGEALERKKGFDRVFCVIDRDTHENFDEAMGLAKDVVKVEVIPSYPCFEFWYLLHFGHTRKPYIRTGKKSAGDTLVDDVRKCANMEEYAKGDEKNIFQTLLPKFNDARTRSVKILSEAIKEKNLNPSTRVHDLMDYFETLQTPQLK